MLHGASCACTPERAVAREMRTALTHGAHACYCASMRWPTLSSRCAGRGLTVLALAVCLSVPVLAETCRVRLVVAGEVQTMQADSGDRVGAVLDRAGVTLGIHDRVYPKPWAEVFDGLEIHVIRVTVQEVYEELILPYSIRLQDDPSLPAGTVRLAAGNCGPGYRKGTFVVYRRSDGVAERVPLGSTVIVPSRPKVYLIGTLGRTGQPLSLPGERVMHATAYSGEDPALSKHTATGVPAGRGVIAVDPSVIPYGTKMWVEGYGLGVAADCGGSIRGDRIDLCFDSYAEALAYGHRQVRVRFIP